MTIKPVNMLESDTQKTLAQSIRDSILEDFKDSVRKELIEIRKELNKKQATHMAKLENSLFSPELYDHYKGVAMMLSKSGIIPASYHGKPEDIFVALEMGYQLGFPVAQSLQDISVINGRPCLWGDGLLSLCLNHPECEDIKEEPIYEGEVIVGYRCTVKRKGHSAHVQQFTLAEAKNAGLINRPTWKAYPNRMLQMRARSLALRDKFADALRGLRSADIEQEDYQVIEGESEKIEEKEIKYNSRTEELKTLLKQKDTEETDNKDKKEKNESLQPITSSQIKKIEELMEKKQWDDIKKLRAFDYFGVTKLKDLREDQAKIFIKKLEK